MKIVVTGKAGQLVRCLRERGGIAGVEVVPLGRPELDLAKPETIGGALERVEPEVVVSAAANTAVDALESDPATAVVVNTDGPGLVAAAAAAMGVPVIHISTDYVFDGSLGRAYVETDAASPLSVYGASKLAGEVAVAAANPSHLILRTAWVYSPFGANFVSSILRRAAGGEALAVVADQRGSPTSGLGLADAILVAAAESAAGRAPRGVYHVAGRGMVSRSEQARHVLDVSRRLGGPFAVVRDITAAEIEAAASRPANSALSSEKFEATFPWVAADWRQASETVVARLVA